MSDSYVYFIRPAGMEGPIKIGHAMQPELRLRQLQNTSPLPLELIGFVPGNMREECRVHAKFVNHHSHGEWFFAHEDVLTTVADLLAGEVRLDDFSDAGPSPCRGGRGPWSVSRRAAWNKSPFAKHNKAKAA